MSNYMKYFVLLESLKFQNVNRDDKDATATVNQIELLKHNLNILEKYEKFEATVEQQLEELCVALHLSATQTKSIKVNSNDVIALYTIRLQYALHRLMSHVHFDSNAIEDLISIKHLKLFIQAVQDLSYYALRCHLHLDFYKSLIFKGIKPADANQPLLFLSIHFFHTLLPNRQLYIANSMEVVIRDFIAAIISLKIDAAFEKSTSLQDILDYLWKYESKIDFFRNILLLKATPNLSFQLDRELHQQLLKKLMSPQGFGNFVSTLNATQNVNPTRNAEIVASIVARRGYSLQVQQVMIKEVFEFSRICLLDINSFSATVLTLRRLYELNDVNQQVIQKILKSHWLPMSDPVDVLSGLIIMEHAQLSELINLWCQLFCSSTVACLPSSLLVPYMKLFLELFSKLPKTSPMRQQLITIIIRCLDNREPCKELPEIIRNLYSSNLPQHWNSLHKRILIVPDVDLSRLTIKIGPADYKSDYNISNILPNLLMSSTHHLLTCKCFMVLLRYMIEQLVEEPTKPSSLDFLSSEEELTSFLHCKYGLKLEIINSLNMMVLFQPLKSQLGSHGELMMLLLEFLKKRTSTETKSTIDMVTDQTLLLILTLQQELFEHNNTIIERPRELCTQLTQLCKHTSNPLVKQSAQMLLTRLNGDWKANFVQNEHPFNKARSLIEQNESHVQVYGIQILIKLLRKKDASTISQGHLIIALALTMLKDKESYTFLNCIRLFVALVHVMESEVLDKLSDEYLSETADLDYRLVVGEAILQTAKELGPFCYKYKAVLLNCYMQGVRSPINEFRMSAYSNLAQLCRILSYQVHHFFHELLQLINIELSSSPAYLPAKRASILVLAELLEGMDNLLEFDHILLPIYRLLHTIEKSECCDMIMRQHASNGLKIINEKCYKFLNPPEILQKEIQVLNIKNNLPKSKGYILDIN